MTADTPIRMLPRQVAIIGAGPGGLAAAAWLRRHGFAPVLFEASDQLGGQWNAASPLSGVWPGMRTNTSRILTAFSELDHAAQTAVYPNQREMLDYLRRYADQEGIAGQIRVSTAVERIEHATEGSGWIVRSRHGGVPRVEQFARVVVASGRHTAPAIPVIEGVRGFSGSGGAAHTQAYKGAAAYRDRAVLVAGCSISALEIASEIALGGARRVTVASRRQRYVLQKMLAGVPADHVAFTRFAALAGAVLPPAALSAGLRHLVVSSSGSPEQFGAPMPDADIFAAGLTQSQHFLPLVAEGRIHTRPWIERISGSDVIFADGTSEQVDALLFGTGYRLSLPFLSEAIAACLNLDDQHIDLHDHTFHPDLPGLAFIGMFDQVGPYFPVLELQARWLAYAWAGLAPSADMSQARYRTARSGPTAIPMHMLATLFARNAGVEPNPDRDPQLRRALLFGPLSPDSFRLEGPDLRTDAAGRTLRAAAAFGRTTSMEMTAEELGQVEAIQSALRAAAA
ncbi:MAG: FAD-dependent oxidoreductase [Pseudomonadota bacterium]